MRLSVTFIDNDMVETMNEPYQNKGHLHDIISICMLKLCGNLICRFFCLIFGAILYQELFTDF